MTADLRDVAADRPAAAPARAWGAAAGLVSAATGLAVATLVAALTAGGETPVSAVSEAAVDRVPRALKEAAIAAFGTGDKAVLVGVVLLVVAAMAGAAGVVALRRRRLGLALAAALPTLAAVAVLARPGAGLRDLLPTVLGGLTGLVLLDRFATAAHRGRDDAGRRALLRALVVTAAAAAVGGGLGQWLAGRRRALEEARAAVALGGRGTAAPPAGADLGVADLAPWRTPNVDFYRIDTAISVPLVRPEEWRLRIHGLVDRPLALDFDELLARGLVDRWTTLTCVSNEVGGTLAGNALWTGVLLGPLLTEAGPHPEADLVLSTSADGWTAGTPTAVLTDGRDALVAVGMNGDPLPVEHGFPARLVVPGLYGYVSATKWVTDLELTRFDAAQAYWTRRGWAERGPILTASRIEAPRPNARLAPGDVVVAGTAWAQHRGVAGVEVRADEGPWVPVTLGRVPTADTWCQWRLDWRATHGTHRLTVRAVDGEGVVQTAATSPPIPRGATGYHTVTVHVG